MFERHSFFVARERFLEQGLGSKTWARSLCVFELGLWVDKGQVRGLYLHIRVPGPNGFEDGAPYTSFFIILYYEHNFDV